MTPPLKSYIVRAKRTVLVDYEVRAASSRQAVEVVLESDNLLTEGDVVSFEVESVEENE